MSDRSAVELETAVARAAGVRNAADAELVALVAEALADGSWEGWRIYTPVQWLMWKVGLSRSTATTIVRLARRAAELPTVIGSFQAGRLSLDQASTVARYTPAAYEASVCELAECATVGQIVSATRQYGFDTDITSRGGGEPVRRGPERSVSFGTDAGDQWRASIRLPADEGAVVESALKASRDRLHDAARTAAKAETGRTGTDASLGVARVSWADALVGMAQSCLGHTASGAEVAARPGVLVHLEVPVDGSDRWHAEAHMGPTLPSALRRYLTCDADISVVWHRDGHPVQVGRTHRIVPRRVRRLVEHRDGGCRVPGCDSTLWVQVHHITHWEDHGETITPNLICLCSHHHRLHHQGQLAITGNADQPHGVTFTNRHGIELPSAGRPRPPSPHALPTAAPYRGPTGERLHRDCVTFNRRPREPAA